MLPMDKVMLADGRIGELINFKKDTNRAAVRVLNAEKQEYEWVMCLLSEISLVCPVCHGTGRIPNTIKNE